MKNIINLLKFGIKTKQNSSAGRKIQFNTQCNMKLHMVQLWEFNKSSTEVKVFN